MKKPRTQRKVVLTCYVNSRDKNTKQLARKLILGARAALSGQTSGWSIELQDEEGTFQSYQLLRYKREVFA